MLLVGMSHRSAPVPVLERVTVGGTERPATLNRLISEDAINEAMLVATCNRVEYYVTCTGFHAGLAAVMGEIIDRTGYEMDDISPYLYIRYAEGAAEHLFAVASGLESMVLGEQQIIGQIRAAYTEADECGTAGSAIHDLAQRALRTGKRVHTETGIDEAGTSMVSVALTDAIRTLQTGTEPDACDALNGRNAVVLGAGAMSSLAATHLGRCGIDKITIANRTVNRAQTLAEHAIEAGVAAEGIALADYVSALADADILISATGSVGPVVSREQVEAVMTVRGTRPLAVVDLSMPRDVSDGVAEIPGVSLFDIEHLQLQSLDELDQDDEAAARAIVSEELSAYLNAQRAMEVAPTVKALRQRAGEVVAAELSRLETKTPDLSDRERAEVTRAVNRVVDKLLHVPTVQVKKLSASPGGPSYAAALQRLFDLPLDTAAGLHSDTDIPADLMVTGRMGELLLPNDSITRPEAGGYRV
ncbi:glutamyl-tRNA reductase [Corynebacterium sp. TAE3-ERU12]|nr:glutamyl-tRNA reductase [Corynebacterium sp. TAE3-ERU12]